MSRCRHTRFSSLPFAAAATPIAKLVCERLASRPKLVFCLRYGAALLLFAVCLCYIALGNYNPSIYTQF